MLKSTIEIQSGNCMPLKHSRRPLFVLVLLCSLTTASAQEMEFGLMGGGAYYLGDLNPGKHFLSSQVAYGALVRYNFDTRWSVKLSGMRSKVQGNSAATTFLPDRDLSFESPLTDISAVAEFNFLPYFTGSKRNAISPYIYAGFSVFFFEPASGGVSLRSLGTEGQNEGYLGRTPYSKLSFAIPFGLGAKISLARRFGIQVYWEMHKTFTDYLDDVSTTYYLDGAAIAPKDIEGLMSDPTRNHDPGMQRGNSQNQDWYSFFGVSLIYKFNLTGKKRCRDLNH